jgi:hypothetical protein
VVWHVLGRLFVRARSACNIPSSGCTYIPPQHDRCCRRRHQRHGRIQERSGLEMYTVSCATLSLLPRRRATSSRRAGFGRCLPSNTSTTPRTSPFPNHRGPLVSVSSRSGAFESWCRSFVFVSFAWLRWCEYGAPARLADSTSWISCFATTRWSVVTLDPEKKQMNNPFYYSLTRRSRVQVRPTRARNNDVWDRRRIVNNTR